MTQDREEYEVQREQWEHEMKNQSNTIGELIAALAKAQSQMTGAKKDSANPFFKSTYADLQSVWDAIREPLSSNGIAVVQTMETIGGQLNVVTILAHSSGEWMRSETPVRTQKDDAQAMGSAITYARRYALSAIAGISQMDDDAESSMGRKPKSTPKPDTEAVKKLEACKTLDDLKAVWEKLTSHQMRSIGAEGLAKHKERVKERVNEAP